MRTVRGGRRFRVLRSRVRDNGLLIGEVEWLDDAGSRPLRPEHATLATLLGELLEKVGGSYASADLRQLEEAGWVGWRLAELLPLIDSQRLSLLQQDDPHRRLDQLLYWMDEELP